MIVSFNLYRKEATVIVKNDKKKRVIKTKICCSCVPEKAEQPVSNFYKSFNPLHADGYVTMCKNCIQEKCVDSNTGEIDVEMFKNILRQIDRPFIDSLWQSSINQYNKRFDGKRVPTDNKRSIISYYFKNLNSLPQFRTLNWVQGIEWNEKDKKNGNIPNFNSQQSNDIKSSKNNEQTYSLNDDDFEVTQDIIRLFGEGYHKNEYKAMWDKYEFLRQNYPNITNLHTEALVTYVRFKVKEEMATANGDAADAEKWNQAATRAADKAKINPSQLSQSDLQGGLNSFSELFKAVEEAVDVIPILPKFRYRPNDAIDFNIWCYVNYIRNLEGKPLCNYEDVYRFYDERKQEYIDQYGDPYGIFKDDPTVENRDKIKKFITLPTDYEDDDNG